MERKNFLKLLSLAPFSLSAMKLKEFEMLTDGLQNQSKRMPVLFTSHGNPFDIVVPEEESRFWSRLHQLGEELQKSYEVKAALVVSAHWCGHGTFVNVAMDQKQIYDYYGFPKEYYEVYYKAKGAPEVAMEVANMIPSINQTTEWGLDHGAWPMLMHLFPDANIPVFQMSIDYYAKPEYHFELGKQLKALRDKGVLIIGSGALVHNLQMAGQKMRTGDMTPYGWEMEYDAWIKQQIDARNIDNILRYETSHKLGKVASPTPDHFVPVLYSLGLMDPSDEISYFFEPEIKLPAFSERSFIIS